MYLNTELIQQINLVIMITVFGSIIKDIIFVTFFICILNKKTTNEEKISTIVGMMDEISNKIRTKAGFLK